MYTHLQVNNSGVFSSAASTVASERGEMLSDHTLLEQYPMRVRLWMVGAQGGRDLCTYAASQSPHLQ